jgi:CRISPR system Cascade subunit CasE
MILSRLFLNPRSREVRRDLADCQEMHRTVMSAFPQVESAAARNELAVLFRVEENREIGLTALLVQSRVQPDWSRLPASYLATTAEGPNPDSKDLTAAWEYLRAGIALNFRLQANPTRKIETKSGAHGERRNGKRVELRTEDDQIKWLTRKAEAGGFEIISVRAAPTVPNVRVTEQAKHHGSRIEPGSPGDEGVRKKLTFASVLFEGLLRVTDPDKFRVALEQGLGPAKAYGFGLLSIAPHRLES